LKQAEEVDTLEGAEMPLPTRDGKEEKEEKEEERQKWKEKNVNNLWDSVDALALRAILEDKTREHIAKSCYTKVHLDVWKETCGGANFMEIGMLSYWKNDQAPEWLACKKYVMKREYAFTKEQEEAFLRLLNEELEEEIVVRVPHTYPRFLNPVFTVPKKGRKWRKVVDCRMLNLLQIFVHFRMAGPEVVQQITRCPGTGRRRSTSSQRSTT
jgi:hypothetical protein